MTATEQLARASLQRFNDGDYQGLRDELGPGFVYEEAGTGRQVSAPDDMIATLQQWKTALPDVEGTVQRLAVDGGTVAMEIVWRGTHSGPLSTPNGDLPASGRTITVWATIWQVWDDGKLVSERHHLDLLSMLAQIGAMVPQG
jgi:steroid delta-isomerase-like uncharacterized protein